MAETIRMGALDLRFLQDKDGTGGALDMFEMVLRPNARMPVPHYHESWDEAVYGLAGTSTWRVGEATVRLGPGEALFIRRGVVHGFANDTQAEATCLSVLTPGVLGPAYFREMAALVAAPEPDLPRMRATMLKYGLIPAPPQ